MGNDKNQTVGERTYLWIVLQMHWNKEIWKN